MKDADTYFELLADAFPVMCASDEFHFLPRAQAAAERYGRMEDMDPDRLSQVAGELRELRHTCLARAEVAPDLEERIDAETLALSAGGVLAELETVQSWRRNPLLYPKIAFIGLDHALTKPLRGGGTEERLYRFLARLRAVPGLLNQAGRNLESAAEAQRRAALDMLTAGRRWLQEAVAGLAEGDLDRPGPAGGELADLREAERLAAAALDDFAARIRELPAEQGHTAALPLPEVLREVFGTRRSVEEIFEIGREQRSEHLAALEALAPRIDASRSWAQLYEAYDPGGAGEGPMQVYARRIDELRRRLLHEGPLTGLPDCPLELAPTPLYLRPVRSSASFAAAFGERADEVSCFHVTPGELAGRGAEDDRRLDRRLRRECLFLTAHETYPGHHLLDCYRRALASPVRRQVENPLFYEGWAFFAECLLLEFGVADQPMLWLVHHKRCLWRALRCIIDTGLALGRLDDGRAAELIEQAGFGPGEAADQVRRFRLNPGYQLCYTLGQYELYRLWERYAPVLGKAGFCTAVLDGGEIPFHLAEARLQSLAAEADASTQERL